MAPAVKTSVTPLEDSRVRVEAEVPPEEVERRLERTARELGRDLRVPGFRKGKVPAPVVMRRIGREAVLEETVRSSLGAWYSDALDAAGIVPVGEPKLDLGDSPGDGGAYTFSIEIGVRPTAKLGRYKGLEVPRRAPRADPAAVEAEIDALRERLAKLDTAERAAGEGDFVVMDYLGRLDGEPFAGGEGQDQLLELGSGRLIPGFEEQLTGARAGDAREVSATFPEDYNAAHLAGREAVFAVTVKEVKEKVLPEVNDDLAVDGAGFDTLEELKEDIASKLSDRDEATVAAEFRASVLDAVVEEAEVEVPEELAHARAHEMWEQMSRTMARQGITPETYLRISGKESEEELVHEAVPDAVQALKREAVLAAVVEAEQIAPTEEEILHELEHPAEHEGVKPEKLLDRLRSAHQLDSFAAELAVNRAAELLAEEAVPVAMPEPEPAAGEDPEPPAQDEPEGEVESVP